jgi:hypothetical protein
VQGGAPQLAMVPNPLSSTDAEDAGEVNAVGANKEATD